MVSPVTLGLKGEEMPGHATTLEAADPDAAARLGPPTTTRSLKLNPKIPTTKAGYSRQTSTLPTEMPRPMMCAGTGRPPPIPHCYWSSEDEVENGKDEGDLRNCPIPVHDRYGSSFPLISLILESYYRDYGPTRHQVEP
jgi:hypothetical protein